VDLRKWTFNTATIHVLDCDLLPYSQCLIFKPLTPNKPFSLKLNDANGKYFTCFKIDTLIISRVYYKLGQLQYLVRALNGKVTDHCKCYAKFRRLVDY